MSTLSLRKIKHDSSAVDNITLDSNGNVGINKTTPRATTGFNSVSLNGTDGSEIWFDASNAAATRLSGTASETRITAQASGSVITMFTGATERVRVDNSGRVTMPYQPCFRVHANNGQAWSISTNGSGFAPPYNYVKFDSGSNFNTSNYRFTAPVTGNYYLEHCFSFDQASMGTVEAKITLNGNETIRSYANSDTDSRGSSTLNFARACGIVRMNAGDYAEATGYNYAGTPRLLNDTVIAITYFCGFLIG